MVLLDGINLYWDSFKNKCEELHGLLSCERGWWFDGKLQS